MRLIDADALEVDLKRQYDEVFGKARKTVNQDDFFIERYSAYYANVVEAEQNGFLEYLKARPTVDAVPVVRCKDCAWRYDDSDCLNPKCGKSWYGCPVTDEHYCSYGERRADNGE